MIDKVIVELDGKELTKEEIKQYTCVSRVVSDIVNEVFERNRPKKVRES